jgi:membrane-associated protease RseP (regulator of RpoE activity)
MEKENQKIYTIVALVALAGVLLSCFVGALAGGMAGFLVGQRQARLGTEQMWQEMPGFPMDEQPYIQPQIPGRGPSGQMGALIRDVVPGMPAAEAGLQPGDIIIGIDGTPVNRMHALPDVIAQYRPGDRVAVRFIRGDQTSSLRVVLAENPDEPGNAYLGIYYEMAGP